jgi:hypothetical protein
VKYLQRILIIFPIVFCAIALQAHALEKSKDGFCHLSQEVLANPDLVIKDAMENSAQNQSKNCFDIYLSDSIEFSERGGLVYPLKGSKIKKAGWGIYRDFKILDSKPGPELDGYQTLIYEVELIYVAMTRDGPTVRFSYLYSLQMGIHKNESEPVL